MPWRLRLTDMLRVTLFEERGKCTLPRPGDRKPVEGLLPSGRRQGAGYFGSIGPVVE